MKKIFSLFLLIFLGFTMCTNPNNNTVTVSESDTFRKGKAQLATMGYTNIVEQSYPLFCCAEDDSFLMSTGFRATGKNGEIVEGCICTALFKGVTIRFK